MGRYRRHGGILVLAGGWGEELGVEEGCLTEFIKLKPTLIKLDRVMAV